MRSKLSMPSDDMAGALLERACRYLEEDFVMEILIFGCIGAAAWIYVKRTEKKAAAYAHRHRIDWERYRRDRAAHRMSDYEADQKLLNGAYNAAAVPSRFFYTLNEKVQTDGFREL